MMFVIFSKVGRRMRINDKWFDGLIPTPSQNGHSQNGRHAEKFNVNVLGWIYDGRQMHESLVHEAATGILSPEGSLRAWKSGSEGQQVGAELLAHRHKPGRLAANFVGPHGRATFEVWGDPRFKATMPDNSLDVRTIYGGADVVAWRRFQFEGQFERPGRCEHLTGVGYFQRICLNFNPFPWKWIWSVFGEGSVFSAYVPYIGPQIFRRTDDFFPAFLERATLSIKGNAYFYWQDTGEMITFDRRRISPILSTKPHPDFLVECESVSGDYLSFRAVSRVRANFVLDERVLEALPRRYNYNEYVFHMEALNGRVAGRPVNERTVGQGFGNCEYTWGFGA